MPTEHLNRCAEAYPVSRCGTAYEEKLMQLSDVKRLAEATSYQDAEAFIADGWCLLAVLPNPDQRGTATPVVYVLGRE